MENIYKDSSINIELWIETLTDKERELFDKGYSVAISGILEHITEIKTILLEKCLDLEDSKRLKAQYLSRVHILDVLDRHYTKRLHLLEPSSD